MKYEKLTIENFRGISSLEITDLQHLNLFVGRNNCGKTSVLEAFFLLSGMSNPQLAINIHTFRDLVFNDDEDFSFMFKNLDFDIPIRLKGKIDAKERKLSITPFFGSFQVRSDKSNINNRTGNLATATNIRIVEGINFDFETFNHDKYHGEFHIKESKITIPGKYKEKLPCSFLNNRIANVVNDKQMEELLISKKLDPVINVLKGIEPAIQDIRMGAKSMVYVDIGAERLIPINVTGDGMRKILALLAAVASMRNGVLLIDEIENGLYFSSLSVLWKALFAACKEYNVQIIATTHSYECIEEFSKVSDSAEPDGDDIRLFRLDKDEEQHRVFVYNAPQLKAGLEKEFEVR
jgi:AAA15 family ATPase/GTPase